ncbi:hypothetical protein GN156_26945, partial [bacterium LRH843]|nr:hypothetical protein [bacterium LRH843]
ANRAATVDALIGEHASSISATESTKGSKGAYDALRASSTIPLVEAPGKGVSVTDIDNKVKDGATQKDGAVALVLEEMRLEDVRVKESSLEAEH